MPMIRPISDLQDKADEISEFCHLSRQPVFITRNGAGDMVVLSISEYERMQARFDLYEKLAVAEREFAEGAEGEDFMTTAKELRGLIHGTDL